MGLRHNLVTPRNGNPLIAAMQDFIATSYVLTQRTFFGPGRVVPVVGRIRRCQITFDIPPRFIKPTALWTDKQMISCLLRPKISDAAGNVSFQGINLEERPKLTAVVIWTCVTWMAGFTCT